MGVLSDQRLAAASLAKDLLVNVHLQGTERCNESVSIARQEVLEGQAEILDRWEQTLIEELQQTILSLSAKIEVVRTLRNAALREAGRQQGMRMANETAKGVDAHERTEAEETQAITDGRKN